MTTRALVLGGGGTVGIAWESGLISGLARGGVDLGQADFTLGTSAGAFVGARLAMGASASALVDPILAETPPPPPQSGAKPATAPDLSPLVMMMAQVHAGTRPAQEVLVEIGAFALAATTADEAAFIATFGRSFAGLPQDAWPERGYACTAVDALTGEFKLWTRESGVGVTRAVASSCSVPGIFPPVTLQGRRYMDGGMRSGLNADQAGGHDLVVVIQVRTGATAGPAAAAADAKVEVELETLQAGGAKTLLIDPDAASLTAMGLNLMDARNRAAAARAGLAQGLAQAQDLKAVWGG